MNAVRDAGTRGLLTMAVVASLAFSGCTKEDVPSADYLSSTTTTARPVPGVIGERVEFAGVELIVSDITAFERTPEGVPRVRAVVRSENGAEVDRGNPRVGLMCDEAPELGEWFRGSTWEPGSLLAPGVARQGELLVGFPPKPDAALYAVASCTNARLRFEIGGPSLGWQRVEFAIDPEVITESVNRPKGRQLPLPLETR